MKERLDVLLVEQGFATSREKAKAIIMSGNVFVNGQREDKAGTTFDPAKSTIEVKGHTLKYVSRGGLKLEKAMQQFTITLEDKICMDIGASTGGFTDCMLQNGAKKVYSVDVGHGQLAWSLRNDERVVCFSHCLFYKLHIFFFSSKACALCHFFLQHVFHIALRIICRLLIPLGIFFNMN